MLFFSFFFLLAPTPEKNVYRNFLRSRRIMGVALLALSANYSVHLFCGIRFISQQAAILMNLSTYFLCYWLFSSALMTLLNRFYLTFRRFAVHLFLWVLFTGVSTYVLFCVPLTSMRQSVDIGLLAGLLLSYGVWLSVRLINTCRQATRSFDDLHSENVGVYVKWMNVITYWAVIYGVGCGLLTFLPDEYINWWILSSIPFYIYLFCSYQNYMLFHEQVERTLEIESEPVGEKEKKEGPKYYESIESRMSPWLENREYAQPGLTIQDVAKKLDTNRTYLAIYIKEKYKVSFREWMTRLRLEYAKTLLREHPEMGILKISEESGFLSQSYFIKTFTEQEGCTPAKWRKKLSAG